MVAAVAPAPAQDKRAEAASELVARRKARKALEHYIPYVSERQPPLHMKLICRKLDQLAAGKFDRLLIAAPPGHAKSFLCSHHFPAHFMARNPGCAVIGASHTDEFASDWGRKVRNLMSGGEHLRLFPQSAITSDSRSAGRWETRDGSTYYAAGVGATITGRRADLVIIDDPLRGAEDADNKDVRDKLWSWYGSDLITRLKGGARIVIVATRWHLDDLTGRLLQASKNGDGDHWETLVLPAVAKSNDILQRKVGAALWPESYPIEVLERRRKDPAMSARMWSALYQQDPVPDTGGIIDRMWFRIWKEPSPPKLLFVVQSWDTALSKKDKAAFSACTTWGVFIEKETGAHGLMLLSCERGRWEYPELRKRAVALSKDYLNSDPDRPRTDANGQLVSMKPDMILVESKQSGLSLIPDLRAADVPAIGFNPDKYGDKDARVRLITPFLEDGRIWVPGQPPGYTMPRRWADEFIDQCASFPAAESRDWVDSMTQVLLKIKQSGWINISYDPTYESGPQLENRPAFY